MQCRALGWTRAFYSPMPVATKRNLCPLGQTPAIQRRTAFTERWFANFSCFPTISLLHSDRRPSRGCHPTGACNEAALLAVSCTDCLCIFRLCRLALAFWPLT